MRNSADPSIHRDREKRLIEHVERLLTDDRLRVDTTGGRRPAISLRRDVSREDREVELKRLMADMDIYDRQVQAQMPVCRQLTVNLSRSWFLIFRKTVAWLRVVCLSPWRDLLENKNPEPMSAQDLAATLAQFASQDNPHAPLTMVVLSTSGFTISAHGLAERKPGRTVILVEPNDAGGWTITAPPEIKALADLFDPELDADKRQRVREEIARRRAEVLSGGISADRLADSTHLPLGLVEEELRSAAKEGEGLVARRIEGRLVMFREGTMPASWASVGGSQMPFIQRVKALFGAKGDNEKKISLLSERRAALSLQRDRAYEEMGVLEARESDLRQQFKEITSSITRRRIASQLVQLRKDLERRQQLLGVLNQQINVIATHLHNLELVQQGQSAQLPDTEELAADAAAAEEVLAELQANTEMAGAVAATGPSGMTEEEQALYEELEREAAGAAAQKTTEAAPTPPAAAPVRTPARTEVASNEPPPLPARPQRERGEAEPG